MYCRTLDGVTPRYVAASSVVKYFLMREESSKNHRCTQAKNAYRRIGPEAGYFIRLGSLSPGPAPPIPRIPEDQPGHP